MMWRRCRGWRVDLMPEGVALDDYETPVVGELSRDGDVWVALVLGEELVASTLRHPSVAEAAIDLATKLGIALPPVEI